MSNHLAIATVTATLQSILQSVANEVGEKVGDKILASIERPTDSQQDKPGLNIFLYRVSVNTTYSNNDLPTRNMMGQFVTKPQIALDLYYLFTFYGKGLIPQRLLGRTMSTLDAQPILPPAKIQRVISNGSSELAESDLAKQIERIRFSPTPLDLEELSKLWSVFLQVPYALSVAYQASVVLIDADVSAQRALPVRQGGARGNAGVGWLPQIEQITPQFLDYSPIQPMLITLHGTALVADDSEILIDGTPITTTLQVLAGGSIRFELPKSVNAGVKTIHIRHRWQEGDSHRSISSNPAAIAVRPGVINRTAQIKLTRQSTSSGVVLAGTYVVDLTPPLIKGQRAKLLLNQIKADAPAALSVNFTGTGSSISIPLSIPENQFSKGDYLVRVQVDNAESSLELVQDAVTGESAYELPAVELEAA